MCELKNLQASGLTTMGHALRTAFDLLNLNRLVSGIDNYGQVSDSRASLALLASAAALSVSYCFKCDSWFEWSSKLYVFYLLCEIEMKESSVEIVMPFAADVLLLNQSSLFSITDSVYRSLQCIYRYYPKN